MGKMGRSSLEAEQFITGIVRLLRRELYQCPNFWRRDLNLCHLVI
jgi:hypothetical protein